MWKKNLQKALIEAVVFRVAPEVTEYGYQIYRLPLYYKHVYTERDLLCMYFETNAKKKKEGKIRPIRVVTHDSKKK